jgi:hypothetical protein
MLPPGCRRADHGEDLAGEGAVRLAGAWAHDPDVEAESGTIDRPGGRAPRRRGKAGNRDERDAKTGAHCFHG